MSLGAPSQWLATQISTLLSTPQTSLIPVVVQTDPNHDSEAHDPFTTRFNDVFMRHARGLVGGQEVDREGLKRALLALQKQWDASGCTYGVCELHYRIEGFHPEVGVKMEFTPTQSTTQRTLIWEACVSKQRNGQPRIKTLMLDGDIDLVLRP